jgi:hypothetical protein
MSDVNAVPRDQLSVDAYQMEWRICERFQDFEISEWGDLRRIVEAPHRCVGDRPRGFIDGDGYLRYVLIALDGFKTTATAYRLVAEAFIGPSPSKFHEVAHNNGSRTCAHYKELRWALRVENHADMMVHGTAPSVGERNPKAKITEADVIAIRREYREIKNSRGARKVSELDEKYGLHRATVIGIARGKSWKHIPMESFQ